MSNRLHRSKQAAEKPEGYLLALRHGEDEAIMDGTHDHSLVPRTIPDVLALASEVAEWYSSIGTYEGVRIYYSDKQRADLTAWFAACKVSSRGIATSVCKAESMRELYQGELNIDRVYFGDDQYQPLIDAWLAYNVAVNSSDLFYRFGDPWKTEEGYKYPELVDHFKALGENQREFSLRLYAFIRSVAVRQDGQLPILVAHRATVTRLQRIIGACNSVDSPLEIAPGDLRFVERHIDRVQTDYAEGVIIPIRSKATLCDVLHRELEYLLTVGDK